MSTRTDYFRGAARVASLVTACESWRGTPFRVRSCVKGAAGGVDCVGFVGSVFLEIGAVPAAVAIPPYAINHAQHSDDSVLRGWFERPEVRARVRRVDEAEAALPGDMVFPVVGRCEHHLGLQLGAVVWHVTRGAGVNSMTLGQLTLAPSRYRLTA